MRSIPAGNSSTFSDRVESEFSLANPCRVAKLRKLWVDGGYTGQTFADWVKQLRPKLEVKVVKRSDSVQGFSVLPRRWVVERTFAWLMHHRRLVRDHERTETSAAAWIYIVMVRLQLRRPA